MIQIKRHIYDSLMTSLVFYYDPLWIIFTNFIFVDFNSIYFIDDLEDMEQIDVLINLAII